MLIELANHNGDIRRLLDKGYALSVDEGHLLVRDIPYLDNERKLRMGAFVAKLIFVDRTHVRPENHVVYFAGAHPCGLDGKPIPNLNGGEHSLPLSKPDVVVERLFSNKPTNGFKDFFETIEHYVTLIAGPAIALHGANPLTFRVDSDSIGESVFKFHDTLTSRAEIGDLTPCFKKDVVAIIGLGGTGSYVLDFLTKTPVQEIRGFDADEYHVHNAFRSPGSLNEEELGQPKAEVYQGRYENFRSGLMLKKMYISRDSANELDGVTFAFVCVDKGTARAEIFDLLISLRIPFIDVGMGLDRKRGSLSGMLRATYYSAGDSAGVRAMGLAEMADDPENLYKTNIQISELNALNACLAVIRYKQLRGFYHDGNNAFHLLLELEGLRIYNEISRE